MKPEELFNDDDKLAIQAAIDAAEASARGIIRLHVEKRSGRDVMSRLRAVFDSYGMRDSLDRNSVLIYIALGDKKVAVFADDGFASSVNDSFLQDMAEGIAEGFKLGEYGNAVTGAIKSIASEMARNFPKGGEKNDILKGVAI